MIKRRGFIKPRKQLLKKRPIKKASALKPTKKRRKKGELTKLKDKLESLQKQIVILKWGTDCWTCPKKNLVGRDLQLGHMPWPRAKLATQCIFLLDYTRPQCSYCNSPYGGQGMGAAATLRMQREGIDVDALWESSQSRKGKIVPIQWFRDQIQEYTSLIEQLKSDSLSTGW